MPRSCEICHQRKVRCDKRSPCSNCVRGNNFCRYPKTERQPRRLHKTTITDVSARLSQLERTDSESHEIHSEDRVSTEEMLVEDGGSSCYVNEALLFRILAEERELQAAMGTPKGTMQEDNTTLFDIGPPFSDFRKGETADRINQPSRSHSISLWRVYLHNVDPLARFLHIPTTEAALYKAINNPSGIEHDLSALLFSIYLAAVTSLPSTDAEQLLNLPKEEALISFKRGLEQSLAAAEFLDSPTMLSLQAMAIYLNCLRVYRPGRSTWTLYGLVMRCAQSIGLHRDGSNFKLSPFKSEMRRRLWWYLCAAEARAAEDYGISAPCITGNPSETRFPSNLDDSDLTPEMTHLPMAKSSWTGMTFSIMIYETTVALPKLYRSSPATWNYEGSGGTTGSNILNEFSAQLNRRYLSHCNPDIPEQQATILIGRLLSIKTDFVMHQRSLNLSPNSTQEYYVATESLLDKACTILEIDLRTRTEDLLRDFRWLLAIYHQYYPLTYALWYLCVNPSSPHVERAWNAVDKTIEIGFHHGLPVKHGFKWMMVQGLRRKAVSIRESAQRQSTIDHTDNGIVALGGFAAESGHASDGRVPDLSFWDMSTADFADWSTLMDNLNVYQFEGGDGVY
ncbi:hypothetical protein OIDMADRAFT_166955 [Oidiodendron maius Zn]|uniref:Zn(2)-C6 fungal-type domain-containing protein n=1 Tax=Oidiodendron maius (strain Zn) TaxID=913774 RepID=A0A0C3H7V0_OIDMZ|nr:hypothetical protein OIDMADRAFT_166955 [Oidiodendron maius Zn]